MLRSMAALPLTGSLWSSLSSSARRVIHSSVLTLLPHKLVAPQSVRMPDTVSGRVTVWMKKVGDAVRAGEPLCEIETKVRGPCVAAHALALGGPLHFSPPLLLGVGWLAGEWGRGGGGGELGAVRLAMDRGWFSHVVARPSPLCTYVVTPPAVVLAVV
jgi:hypothetical protein